MISAYSKLVSAHPDNDRLRSKVLDVLKDLDDHMDADLQQRACEYIRVLTKADLSEHVFGLMPPFSEKVHASNPLVGRLKDMKNSRAKQRNDLDVDATVDVAETAKARTESALTGDTGSAG